MIYRLKPSYLNVIEKLFQELEDGPDYLEAAELITQEFNRLPYTPSDGLAVTVYVYDESRGYFPFTVSNEHFEEKPTT